MPALQAGLHLLCGCQDSTVMVAILLAGFAGLVAFPQILYAVPQVPTHTTSVSVWRQLCSWIYR